MADASVGGRWWETAVGYEVYLRSFADGDGDGTGDLPGLIDRLDHLDSLGIDVVWITPFMPSPGADHGYDVADYCDIDPLFGTLRDFDRLTAEAHARGIRVLVDIVPNHSSSQHPWFLDAVSGPDSAKRDWYLWRDPAPDGGPPNNWVSYFGGPAWTLDPPSGQYYCHLFLPEQPDLNWRNPEVRAAFDDILRFWLDRGADGFRIDVAHSLLKDPDFRDNPQVSEIPPGADPMHAFLSFEHVHDMDQDDNPEIFRHWHSIAAEYDALLLGEIALDDFDRVRRYTDGGDALHRVFALRTTWMTWNPEYVAASVRDLAAKVGPGVAWAFSCHDQPRPVTRFGGGQRGADRTMLLSVLSLALDGMPFLYQGQELGIGDGEPLAGVREDPIAVRNEGAAGRDGCRTPMPWTDGPQNGFTTAGAWLPAAVRPFDETVAGQRNRPGSPLERHRELLAFWSRGRGLADRPAGFVPTGDDLVIVAHRGRIVAVANLSERTTEAPLPDGTWSVVFSSRHGTMEQAVDGAVSVPAESALLLRG